MEKLILETDKGTEVKYDGLLITMLDKLIERVEKHNFDNLLIIDGDEGYGKSTLAVQIASYVSYKTTRKFDVNNIFFNIEDMIKFARSGNKEIIIWDEAALGGLSTEGYNKSQIVLTQLLMVARKKNHFYIFVIPKFVRLKEQIFDRASTLIHVFSYDRIKRGHFYYFNTSTKNRLYANWKLKRNLANLGYGRFKLFKGEFGNNFGDLIDEGEYDRKKDEAIMNIGNFQNNSREKKRLDIIKEQILKSEMNKEDKAKYLGITVRTLNKWLVEMNNPKE